MEENKDHYELLEVSKNASLETIKAAYKSMCKKYHPDVSTFDENTAEAKMKMINEAYAVLSDPSERRRYDRNISLVPSVTIIRKQQDIKAQAEERERAKERARESARREADLFQKKKSEYQEKKILDFKPKPKKNGLNFFLSLILFVLFSTVAFSLFNNYEKSKLNDNGIVEKTYSYSESEMLYEEIKKDKTTLDSTIQRLNLLNSKISDYKAQYESAGGDSIYKVYKDAVKEYNELYNQYMKESNDYNKKVERYNSLNGK